MSLYTEYNYVLQIDPRDVLAARSCRELIQRYAREWREKAIRELPRPPFGLKWAFVDHPSVQGYTVTMCFDLVPDPDAKPKFRESVRRRWAAYS